MNEIFAIFADLPNRLEHLPVGVMIMLVINVIGLALKAAQIFPNRCIPLTLIGLGALFNCGVGDPGSVSYKIPHPYVALAAYGSIISFAAWAAHKILIKRLEKYLPPWFLRYVSYDTNSFVKSEINKTP